MELRVEFGTDQTGSPATELRMIKGDITEQSNAEFFEMVKNFKK